MEARPRPYTDKDMPERNQLTKLGFTNVTGEASAMMVQANFLEESSTNYVRNASTGMHA